MRKIRKGVFETNSSSMHSIAVVGDDRHVTREELTDSDDWLGERIYICDGEWELDHWWQRNFGRSPFQILTKFEDKFYYAVCEYLGYKFCDDDDYDELVQMFEEIAEDVVGATIKWRMQECPVFLDAEGNVLKRKELRFERLEGKRAIYSYTDEDGKKHEAHESEDEVYEFPNVGVIDHQSAGLLKRFLQKKKITLKEFLTNKKYVIIIDGDEYYEWEQLKRSGVINLSNIREEFK